MLNTDFSDFFDSDDDAIFLEASNYLPIDLTSTKSDLTTEKYAASHARKRNASASVISSELEERVSPFKRSNKNILKEIELSISQTNSKTSKKENDIIASVSSDINSPNALHNPIKNSVTPDSISYVNSRFTPGFTPKAKKRKFPGPAGLIEVFNETNEEKTMLCRSNKAYALDNDFQNIVSSQFSPEQLSLPSWQRLQTVVSSCSSLHSTAKHYSIQRALLESSKKKLPKHMVIPVLCVLVKNISFKGSTTICTFMDDTGEINGKIDPEVLSEYKEYMIEGAALILKKVTSLCNLLIVKTANLVSLYLPDGTEKHLESLERVFEMPEPLKSMHCECLKPSHQNYVEGIIHNCNSSGFKTVCVNDNLIRDNQSNIPVKKNPPTIIVLDSKSDTSVIKASSDTGSMRSDAFLENLLSEDNCIDEFDELLGSLDEKSFLGDT